jgi:LysR family transcriptional activator of nhaA
VAHRIREGFPHSLDGEAFILPAEGYALRRSLDEWFGKLDVRPRVVAEIEDSALIKVVAESGAGMFAAPSVIGLDICEKYAVERLGRAEGITEQFFAITVDRRLKHSAVVAISEDARNNLFLAEFMVLESFSLDMPTVVGTRPGVVLPTRFEAVYNDATSAYEFVFSGFSTS